MSKPDPKKGTGKNQRVVDVDCTQMKTQRTL